MKLDSASQGLLKSPKISCSWLHLARQTNVSFHEPLVADGKPETAGTGDFGSTTRVLAKQVLK